MHAESEREIRERIDATRVRMGSTIEEIGDRVNPDRVRREIKARAREQVHDVKENVKNKARDTMRGIGDEVNEKGRGIWSAIRSNPIPAGMVGVGLAWLMANGGDRDRDRDRDRGYAGARRPDTRPYEYEQETAPGGITRGYSAATHGVTRDDSTDDRDLTDKARGKVGDAAERVRDRADDAIDTVREKASHFADEASDRFDDARDRVEHMADRAWSQAGRAERRVEDMVRENPLTAGVVAAALGFTAGMMVPESRREREMFGPTRDRLVDKAQHRLRDAGDKIGDIARETASDAKQRVVDEVVGDGDSSQGDAMSDPGR